MTFEKMASNSNKIDRGSRKTPQAQMVTGRSYFSLSHRRRRLRIETINKWIIILIDHVVMLFYLPTLVCTFRQVEYRNMYWDGELNQILNLNTFLCV